MRELLAIGVVVSLLMAGCLADDSGGPEGPEEPPLPSLADLGCDFTYPDNTTPVPCEHGFAVNPVEERQRPSLLDDLVLCLHHNEDWRVIYSIYWDPVANQYSLYYEAPDINGTLHGLFYTRDGEIADGNLLISWYDGPTTGAVVPLTDQELEQNQQFVLRFYTHSYESPTQELNGGTIRAYWSLFDDRPYPLQALETGGSTYYFDELRVDANQTTYPYDLRPFSAEGADFNITVEADHVQDFRDRFNHTPHTPLTADCM